MYWAVFAELLPLKVSREALQGTGLIVFLWGLNIKCLLFWSSKMTFSFICNVKLHIMSLGKTLGLFS